MESHQTEPDRPERPVVGSVEPAVGDTVAAALLAAGSVAPSTALELAAPVGAPARVPPDPEPTIEGDIESLVRSGFDAYNASDWAHLESIYHPQMVWRFPGAVIEGRGRIIDRHRTEQAASPHHDQVRSITVAGQVAYVEHSVHLNVRRRNIEWPMFAILRWDHGRLRHEQTFWGEIPDLVPWNW